MHWRRYQEYQGHWQREVVLAIEPADRNDPFLSFRIEQYRKIGKVVRLQILRTQPSDRQGINP